MMGISSQKASAAGVPYEEAQKRYQLQLLVALWKNEQPGFLEGDRVWSSVCSDLVDQGEEAVLGAWEQDSVDRN